MNPKKGGIPPAAYEQTREPSLAHGRIETKATDERRRGGRKAMTPRKRRIVNNDRSVDICNTRPRA